MKRWEGKTVLVTGGSAGLGKAVARQFAQLGANVVCLARDQARLEEFAREMSDEGFDILTLSADVTVPEQVEQAVDQTLERFGRLDMLINNVGKSTRTDLMKTQLDDYREWMELNFYALVSCTQICLPHLIETSGHVINIGSLSAKTAWPYMGPYTTSKFAVAAYTHQLRLEGPDNVHVMLVCSGPLKRADAGRRYHQAAADLPSNAAEPGAGLKLRGLDPQVLARRIVRSCERRKPELICPWSARIYFAISYFSPSIGDWILRKFMKNGGSSKSDQSS